MHGPASSAGVRADIWWTLHLGMDADAEQSVAATLTTKEVHDSAEVGSLLDQVTASVVSSTGAGAYDQEGVASTVTERHSEPAIIVLPRATVVPSEVAETAPTRRGRHFQHIAAYGRRGW